MKRTIPWLALAVLAGLVHAQQVTPWWDPSPHRVDFVPVDNDVRLEVLEWGGSGPPLVLLACYLSTHVYDEFAPKLTDQGHRSASRRRYSRLLVP